MLILYQQPYLIAMVSKFTYDNGTCQENSDMYDVPGAPHKLSCKPTWLAGYPPLTHTLRTNKYLLKN